jgi:hypothetical protein
VGETCVFEPVPAVKNILPAHAPACHLSVFSVEMSEVSSVGGQQIVGISVSRSQPTYPTHGILSSARKSD